MSEEEIRDGKGRWRKGYTGNAAGRPKSIGWHASVRQEMRESSREVLGAVLAAAVAGDMAAASLWMSRVLATQRSDPVTLPNPTGTLADMARAIMEQIATGAVGAADGAEVLQAMASASRVIELDELTKRISALELQAKP